ncbi:MAG TPA: DUF4416 family protein [Spirochaetota bacterium]|nr:DUF4416 family protein [Spirochaetota bacterium]HPC39424.1 DUF4416 family protein [Spirochaetota bacterium]HPL17308.1 DUF4416 family protein [Spirochaetota bacterium]HQF06761.1 DUF4416 family protein [Spirochaetota bacterium]HQH95620.1 DUF4416 family protein [Spirochaetota bacterium]
MSEPVIPARAKLFIGVLFSSEVILDAVEKALVKKFGEMDFRTKNIPFVHTKYYSDMGSAQLKVLFSFRRLIRREDIVEIKLFTNRLEKRFAENKTRKVNIDPGYLTLSNVYLATCKDFFHRTYLRKGVFLENEYRYVARRYQPWEWTYPDYQKPEYLYFFHEVRRMYHNQLRG